MLSNLMPLSGVRPFPADPHTPPLILDIRLNKLPSDHIDAIKPLVYDGLLTMVCMGRDRLISYQELAVVLGGTIGLDDPHSASYLPVEAHLPRRLMLCPVRP